MFKIWWCFYWRLACAKKDGVNWDIVKAGTYSLLMKELSLRKPHKLNNGELHKLKPLQLFAVWTIISALSHYKACWNTLAIQSMHWRPDKGLDQNLMCPLKETVAGLRGREMTRCEERLLLGYPSISHTWSEIEQSSSSFGAPFPI